MTLKLQIVSDIHAEFWSSKQRFNFIKPSAPILVLLGDTCCVGSDDDFALFKRFVNEHIPQYEHIIIISGNHEYYYNPSRKSRRPTKENTMEGCDKKIKDYCKTNKKLHYLNNNTMDINVGKKNYLLIGSVLWSNIPASQYQSIANIMSDYRYIYVTDSKTKKIRLVTPAEITALHIKNKRYIQTQIKKAAKQNKKAIVLTHHKPYLNPDHKTNSCLVAYESDLKSIISKPVVLWGYGHTHIKDRSKINGVQMISNPKGYPYQQTLFNKELSLSL